MPDELERLRNKIKDHEERISQLEDELSSHSTIKSTNSMREFVEKINPSNHEERALAIGYYLEHHDGQENFSMKDIEEGYRKCKRTPYSNMSMLSKQLREKREWIMEDDVDDEVKKFVITAGGEKYIEEVLGNE